MLYLFIFLFFYRGLTKIIKLDKTSKNYNHYKLCKDCKHFLPTFIGDKYDVGDYFGKCNLYGKINLVTGEIDNEYASNVRIFDTMCGINATHFENKNKTTELGSYIYPL
jgi:hypothetical protein